MKWQLILQHFRRFIYVTAHFPTAHSPPFPSLTYATAHSLALPLLLLRQSSFSNPSFAFPTSQTLHLRHLASRPCILPAIAPLIKEIIHYNTGLVLTCLCARIKKVFMILPIILLFFLIWRARHTPSGHLGRSAHIPESLTIFFSSSLSLYLFHGYTLVCGWLDDNEIFYLNLTYIFTLNLIYLLS